MKDLIEFSAIIKETGRGGASVDLPFNVEATFNKKRVKIIATFDGVVYRGSLVRYGGPDYFLLIRKDIRAQIGKDIGDMVDVTIKEDTAPRIVEVPPDFQKILEANPNELKFFNGLSYTHQKEYVNWIKDAKKEETRIRRMNKAIENMKVGKKGK